VREELRKGTGEREREANGEAAEDDLGESGGTIELDTSH
jgi:hypothetical protein